VSNNFILACIIFKVCSGQKLIQGDSWAELYDRLQTFSKESEKTVMRLKNVADKGFYPAVTMELVQ
jgi:hypothetical protein